MKPVLSGQAMRDADRFTIDEIGIPGFTLMESAGRGAARTIKDWLGATGSTAPSFGIACGKGNNGGDGLVLARVLAGEGRSVAVFMALGSKGLTPDAAKNLEILRRLAPPSLRWADTVNDLAGSTVLVDALLGTGQHGPPRPPLAPTLAWMNGQRALKVALDIPTGLDSDTGGQFGNTFSADLTVTLGALKAGLLFGSGPDVSGSVRVVEIGIPEDALQAGASEAGCGLLVDDAFVRQALPQPARIGHKYSTGPALVVGGSSKYPGAPALAASAAARVGSGYVATALPDGVPWNGPTEIPRIDSDGEELESWLERAKAVLVGPGMGRGTAAEALFNQVVQKTKHPLVVDADGLRVLGNLGGLDLARSNPWVITPHAAEFDHLRGSLPATGGHHADADDSNPAETARSWASRWNVVLVLKGNPTVIASPDGRVAIAAVGGPELATAGTGDVLSGMCVGLLAMGLAPFDAAVCAVHLGGCSAARYVKDRGLASMMAGDIIRLLPLVLSERFQR
jgi:ADP-dependent NAD(P)H-hydrate dehydratase / NAD(P)H-hydrate epimerase